MLLRVRLLSRIACGMLLAQCVASWPLWLGTQVFPQVPVLAFLQSVPPAFDLVLTSCLALAGLATLISSFAGQPSASRIIRYSWRAVMLFLLLLMLLNQQRIQAWAWQGILLALCFQLRSPGQTLALLRWLTISIYLYSAVSKCDASFLQTHGQVLLDGFLNVAGGQKLDSPWLRSILIAGFPLGELLVALLLAIPGTRRWGCLMSLVLHLMLITVLGPFGLNHHPPVLIWNLFFLLQNPVLFPGREAEPVAEGTRTIWSSPRSLLLALVILVAPALEWFDRMDVWPAWGLYASRGAKVQVEISRSQFDSLPESLRPFSTPLPQEPNWLRVDLFRWSFAETGAPANPEDRFLLGVANSLTDPLPDGSFRITHFSTANRQTGNRTRVDLQTHEELRRFQEHYWLGTTPRKKFN